MATDTQERQPKLIDVKTSEAGREAERYGEMCDDIAAKKDLLIKQAEKVVQALKKSGQKTLSYKDDYGYVHTFTVVEGVVKLRHSKREEA